MSSHHAPKPEVPIHLRGILTVAEAAAFAGIGESKMRELLALGHLSPHPHFPSTRIARRELDRWMALTEREIAA